tara:strand:- start:326 stop:1429 length:1104 start_codon:yes stop_codon:yes gene_type:complete
MDTDITIVGAGIIGLSISYYLSNAGYKVILLEKEKTYGLGVSSRSTEVIHSGAYYATNSLKGKLCIRGKDLIYNFCKKNKVPYKKIPKLFLALTKDNIPDLERIEKQARTNGLLDLKILDKNHLKNYEPHLSGYMALMSPSAGIFDVSYFMHVLAQKCITNDVVIAPNSPFHNADFKDGSVKVSVAGLDPMMIKSRLVINAGGLDSLMISKKIFPNQNMPMSKPTKGCYARYSGKSPINSIIYPSFTPGQITERVDATPDLNGGLRFGPSIENSNDISDYSIPENLKDRFFNSIRQYLPNIKSNKINLDYSAFRPKIDIEGTKNPDFIFNWSHNNLWLDLWGMESPAITSSLAIGEYVLEAVIKKLK